MSPDSNKYEASVEFPDVCKVPAPPAPFVPVPYPNVQYEKNLMRANKIDAKVKVGNKQALLLQQEAITNLEAATGKSVLSASQATMMGRTVHMAGTGVKAEGKSAMIRTTMMSTTSQNGATANTPGASITPSQTKVLLLD